MSDSRAGDGIDISNGRLTRDHIGQDEWLITVEYEDGVVRQYVSSEPYNISLTDYFRYDVSENRAVKRFIIE